MTFLRALDGWLVKIETGFLVVFLSVMILLSFSQVVTRNLFGIGFLWGDPLVRHLLIWVGFLGAAIATHEERHISIDALTKYLSPRFKAGSCVITSLFAIVVCYLLANAALTFLMDEMGAGEEFLLSIPLWAAILIIPSGYVLMAVHFLVKVIEHGAVLFGQGGEAPQ